MTDDWQPMETAPRDGTVIEVLVCGVPWYVAWVLVGVDENDNDAYNWVCEDDDDPDGWDDGVCWARNANDEPSPRPTAWRPVKETER